MQKINQCFSTLGCHDRSLNEIVLLAKTYSMDALEIRGINSVMDNAAIEDFSDEKAESTKRYFREAGIKPLILGTSCKFHDDRREIMIEKAIQEIIIAEKIGFQAVRVFGNLIQGEEHECITRVADALNRVCQEAQKYGIKVYLEVHGDFNTAERLEELINQIEYQDSFGLIWDIYHTHAVIKENWLDFYQKMKPYIHHVHLKDCIGQTLVLPGKGELQIKEIVMTMIQEGYSGYFSLEWERKWHPELEEIETALSALKTCLS